jgi:hypothetical protein
MAVNVVILTAEPQGAQRSFFDGWLFTEVRSLAGAKAAAGGDRKGKTTVGSLQPMRPERNGLMNLKQFH